MVIKSRAQIEPIQGRKTASGDPMRLRAAMLERRRFRSSPATVAPE